jgi:hypothetical protein
MNKKNYEKIVFIQNKSNNYDKYKSYLLDYDDDENEVVNWIDNNCINKEYFDCGCCDDCLCDDNIECINCGCNCNDDTDDDDEDEENEDKENDNKCISNLSNFNINVIKNEINQKLVRITLNFNVMLDNKKIETINIDLDINSKTYLKIAEELFTK